MAAKKITSGLFRSKEFSLLPKAVQSLGRTALHSIEWGICDHIDDVDYDAIEQMVQECVDLAGSKVDDSWMFFLYSQVIENYDDLNKRWPWPVVRHNGSLWTRSIYGRLFGSVAVWRLDLATRAVARDDWRSAMNELALAGSALHFAGTGEGQDDRNINHADRHGRGAKSRWSNDPTQLAKHHMRAEWSRWQQDRSLFKYPRDYRSAMLTRFPNVADGTLKNWMSAWGKERKSSL